MSDIANPMTLEAPVRTEEPPAGAAQSGVAEERSSRGIARALWVSAVNWTFTLLALPCIFATALVLSALNPLYNPGPLVFRQERIGRGGRIFTIYKFRTMTASTEGGTLCIDANASRITPLGRALRTFRVDELPNFINVILGDMNVIGPRPDAREHAEIYIKTVHGYLDRFEVKPGITGFAQVVQGYAASEGSTRKKARYDRFYVLHRSVRLDVFVIVRTIQVMLTGFGSR